MDLGTIQRRLETKYYSSTASCLADFTLMFSNCHLYNKPGTDITNMCHELEKVYHSRLAAMPQEVGNAP